MRAKTHEIVNSCSSEPTTIGESKKTKEWSDAMHVEFTTLKKNNSWEVG